MQNMNAFTVARLSLNRNSIGDILNQFLFDSIYLVHNDKISYFNVHVFVIYSVQGGNVFDFI